MKIFMDNELIKFLTKNTSLSGELIASIVESTVIKEFKKGTVLLKAGDCVNACYLKLNK